MLNVDVVVPVHNSIHWVAWCLEELMRHRTSMICSVVVVDDNSGVEQLEQLKLVLRNYPDVRFVQNFGEEHGFGAACNLGFSHCSSPLVLFLNTDCLLTEGVVEKLAYAFETDSRVALSCPVSNNSPDLTFPMFPGRSYRKMSEICSKAFEHDSSTAIVDACTVVGNCLMVDASFFARAKGFSAEWGIGYGEETDLNMKAVSMGKRGVAVLNAYVYHFGGGTFNYKAEIDSHRQKNFKLFMSKWGKEYAALADLVKKNPPLQRLESAIEGRFDSRNIRLTPDVIFYLPGISQSVGGIHAVIAVCNELIRAGIDATCALIGVSSEANVRNFKEPVLFNFLYYASDFDFVNDAAVRPKIVVSTIFTSAKVASVYSEAKKCLHIQFIQGYELFFDNGTRAAEVIQSYEYGSRFITTSSWLRDMVARHLNDGRELVRLPIIVNGGVFFNSNAVQKVFDVTFVLRAAPDKGQWLVMEIIDRVIRSSDLHILLFKSGEYKIPENWTDRVTIKELPIDQYSLAQLLRKTKVFVDASLHEGFGLMPFEAMLCGARLVCSDSGGVRDFVNEHTGVIVSRTLDVDGYMYAINSQLHACNGNFGSSDWLEVNSSTSLWIKYFNETIASYSQPHYDFPELRSTNVVQNDFIRKPSLIFSLSVKFYMKIRPIVPKRIHRALRAFFMEGR